jgi:hypothetical protein
VKLFGVQRRRETAKPLQFLELIKATFDCGRNTRQQLAGVRHHKGHLLNPRKEDFLTLMMQSSFFQERHKTGLFASYDLFREQAIKKARSLNIPQSRFKARKGWAIRFMCQMGLALWCRMMIFQKKCCISNALDGFEDVIVWKDDVEDKDDSDWMDSTDNNPVCS